MLQKKSKTATKMAKTDEKENKAIKWLRDNQDQALEARPR